MSKSGYQQITVSPEMWEFRVALWQKGVHEILAKPVFGHGYGSLTFSNRFGEHPDQGSSAGLHSLFLMVAFGSGVPALLCLLWVFGKAVSSLVAGAAREVAGEKALILIGVAVMIMGFAVRNLFDYMSAGSIACLFWILVAIGLKSGTVFCTTSLVRGTGDNTCAR